MEQFDIAVLGAGPAGTIFARQLGAQYRTCLIDPKNDRADSYRKPCGGLLSPDAQKALARYDLTLPKSVLVNPQIFAVKTVDLRSGLTRHYQRTYVNLDRHAFDRWLMSLVPDRVARIEARAVRITREGGQMRVELADGQSVLARYLVGADGANSLARRFAFPDKKMNEYVAIQQWFAETNANPFYSCVFDPQTSDCCSWSVSKDDMMVFGGAFRKHKCRERFEEQKRKLAAHGFRFGEPLRTEACLLLRPRSAFGFAMGARDVFLIGEAAGLVSPSSLEGVSWAINSAQALADALNAGEQNAFGRYLRRTRVLRLKLLLKIVKCPFLYRPGLRALVMKSGVRALDMHDSPA